MDIKILDSWLREYLDTKAKPDQIAKYLSLCGPSVQRVNKFEKDFVYDIEVTTNRVDSASIYGIAREASVILPKFKVSAKFKRIKNDSKYNFVKRVSYLNATVDSSLCPRFTAVLVKKVKIGESPEWMKKRLESAGVRAINNVVDISNYIMLALGQPVHTFDYDKIEGHKMILRESKKREKITTLDAKTFTLPGGDIVIEDGSGKLIDLAGVMGGNLSMVDDTTKNVLLFVQTYDAERIRRTSMNLAQRTQAATIFEKGTDPELVTDGVLMGIKLFTKLTGGTPVKNILDIYANPYKAKKILTTLEFIVNRLGISIFKKEITDTLNSLEFETKWKGQTLEVWVPSFRAGDITIEEDILEEIARIYVYHNLPSILMTGPIPSEAPLKQFEFEAKVKDILSGWGGVEVYTPSLVPKEYVKDAAYRLKNPLGEGSEYLRTSMMPSLVSATKENLGTVEKFHLFEMANIYIPRKNDLPEERLMLAGIFEGYEYRNAKGIVEVFLQKLNIEEEFHSDEEEAFAAGKFLTVKNFGKFGVIEKNNFIYYEFEIEKLFAQSGKLKGYKNIPKYPAQIEDITFDLPKRVRIGDIFNFISNFDIRISNLELKDTFNDSYTFRIWYQDPNKTLTDAEVAKIRNEIIKEVKNKFGGTVKD